MNIQLFQQFSLHLIIQQLLAAVPSPITPVKNQHRPFAHRVGWDIQAVSSDRGKLQGRKCVAHIQHWSLFTRHFKHSSHYNHKILSQALYFGFIITAGSSSRLNIVASGLTASSSKFCRNRLIQQTCMPKVFAPAASQAFEETKRI